MSKSRTLFLVRHGQTEWNAERRMQGQFDSPLTALGKRQADTNGRFLAEFDIRQIYASPLGRVRNTIDIMSKYVDAPVMFDERLSEWNSGDWSSHLYAELAWRWPYEFSTWEEDRYWVRPPKGENYPDMIKRAKSVLDAVLNDPSRNIAIVSHGMIGRALLAVLLHLNDREVLKIRQRNDIVIRIDISDDITASHFVGGRGPKQWLPREH